MKLKTFDELIDRVKNSGRKFRVAVANAGDAHTLEAVVTASRAGIVSPVLVGDEAAIRAGLAALNVTVPDTDIVSASDAADAAEKAVALVRAGKADFLMKGKLDTAVLLKAVVNKEHGLGTGKLMSIFLLAQIPGYHKLISVVDGGMVTYPTLEQKKGIIENTVWALRALGVECPKVGVLAAIEKVNPKMPATVDAAELKKLGEAGEFGPNVLVEGPIAMDLAVSAHCAEVKGFKSEVAGDADIFIVPNIEAGNIMGKTLGDILGAKAAGVIVGTDTPIVMCSRADNDETKLCSIALGCLMAGLNK